MTSPESTTLHESEAIFPHADSFCQHMQNLRDQLIRLTPEFDCLQEDVEIFLLCGSFAQLGIRPSKLRKGKTDTTLSHLQKEFKKFTSQFSVVMGDFGQCFRMVCDARSFFDFPHDACPYAPHYHIYVEYRELLEDYTEVLGVSTACCELVIEGRRRFAEARQEGEVTSQAGVPEVD